ncbi:Hypothetical_protein [Hexamita inflata]|uniref:Hypothetical_protein n=1 Tax=Hexamita inflata TaxID=28002 RepID=A0AA86TY80_9EUKA|nr:Hypothetical protein HINF_LOCUS12723 [Hexamita inflata]
MLTYRQLNAGCALKQHSKLKITNHGFVMHLNQNQCQSVIAYIVYQTLQIDDNPKLQMCSLTTVLKQFVLKPDTDENCKFRKQLRRITPAINLSPIVRSVSRKLGSDLLIAKEEVWSFLKADRNWSAKRFN